jgi:hypothetical protein
MFEVGRESIRRVVVGEAAAIRVANFYPKTCCKEISERVLQEQSQNRKEMSESRRRYFADVYNNAGQLRGLLGDLPNPFDHAKRWLEARWGSRLRQLDGRLRGADIMAFPGGSCSLPHSDRMEWDEPLFASPGTQLAILVYLRMPYSGGELVLWNMRPNRDRYNSLRGGQSYGLDETQLPKPVRAIKPNEGDLIVFSTHTVHAVRYCPTPRITASFFVWHSPTTDELSYRGRLPRNRRNQSRRMDVDDSLIPFLDTEIEKPTEVH